LFLKIFARMDRVSSKVNEVTLYTISVLPSMCD
jgi:hypothetical protein